MGTENLSLFDKWFKVADEDGDGKIAGGEAVKFFQRSGLPQASLAEVWQLASSGAAALTKAQFSGAMQLVSLAQQNGGAINQQVARQIMIGLGPKLPPPRMQGLPVPPELGGAAGGGGGAGMPSWGGLSSMPGAAFPSSGGTGGYLAQAGLRAPPPQARGAFPMSGPTGALMPGHAGGGGFPGSGLTGGIPTHQHLQQGGWGGQPAFQQQQQQFPAAGPTGGYGGAFPTSGPTGSGMMGPGGLPPMTPAEEQQYTAAFARLDPQHTGSVQGGVVFPVFSSSGLSREVLRDIWSLVAGNRSALTQPEFISAHYLIDVARRGLHLPQHLPPGPFPPRAGGPSSQHSSPGQYPMQQPQQPAADFSLVGPGAVPQAHLQSQQPAPAEDPIAAVNDAFATLGASLGVPQHLIGGDAGGGLGATGSVAAPPPYMGPTKDMEAFGVTDPADLPYRKKEFYEQSLKELTLFKHRLDGKLLQFEGSSGKAVEEADALEKQSRDLHSAMEEAAESVGKYEQKIDEALQQEEQANKLFEDLSRRRAKLSSVTVQNVEHDEMVAASVESVVEDSERQLQNYKDIADGGKSRRPQLEENLLTVDAKLKTANAEVQSLKAEMDRLRAMLDGVASSGPSSDLQEVLKATTVLHAGLLKDVASAGLAPPRITPDHENKSGLQWTPDAAAAAVDPNDSFENGSSNAVAAGPPPLFKTGPQPTPPTTKAPMAPQAPLFSKGEAVWYVKGGNRIEGTVVGIDQSIQPPSYSVQLPGGERETEGKYLEKRSTSGSPSNGNGPSATPAKPPPQPDHVFDPAAAFGFEPQQPFPATAPAPDAASGSTNDDPFSAFGF